MNFFFFSDVWLDRADSLRGLQEIFDNCIENSFIPKVIDFCGNFTSSRIAQGNTPFLSFSVFDPHRQCTLGRAYYVSAVLIDRDVMFCSDQASTLAPTAVRLLSITLLLFCFYTRMQT
jgi:hypothetical protein